MKRCHRCGEPWVSEKKQPGVKECCGKCSAYLHCCLNCKWHRPSAHNECYIPDSDWVGDRLGGNFCEHFEFSGEERKQEAVGKKEKARTALEDLLGGKAGDSKGPKSLDDLFGGG